MAFSWATVKDGDIILADDINNIAQAVIDTQTDVTTAATAAADAAADAAAAQETADTKADSVADNGGFVAGEGASVGDDGGGCAIGYYASVTYGGGAVGYKASARTGFAGGQEAQSTGFGGAIGASVSTNSGGAVGYTATSTHGFAGGRNTLTSDGVAVGDDAKTADADGNAIDAIQLGAGTNSEEKTLKVYDYQLMDADGNIPYDRMQAATDVAGEAQTAAETAQTAADNAQKTAETAQTAADNAQKIAESKIEKKVVDGLPSTTAEYDFEDQTSKFVNSYRTACSVEADEDNGGYYQKITNSGNSNTYREAVFDCSDIFADATVATVEFDALFAGRWHISLADLSQRPGESSGSNYTESGCAFSIGTTNGSTIKVYGADGTMTLTGWKTVKAVLDFSAKTAEYTVTDRTEGTVLQTGTIPFRDTSITAITGFEAYTWSSGDLLIDNIKITALMDVDENAMYLISDGNGGYTAWMYIDDEPIQITGGTSETAIEDVTGKAKWLTTAGVDMVNSINNMKRQLAKGIYETAKGALVAHQNTTVFKEVTMSCTLAAGIEVIISDTTQTSSDNGWFGDGDVIPFYIESDNFDSYDRDGNSNYQKYVAAGCLVARENSDGNITIETTLADIPSSEFEADTTGVVGDVKYFTATFKWYQPEGTDYPLEAIPKV